MCLLLAALWPAAVLADGDTFTVTYKTNAGVEMGTVTYTVGDSNTFPQVAEFSTYFSSFLSKASQAGTVAIPPEDRRWYTDSDFTQVATFPEGQAGENYTIYCRFTTGLSIDDISNTGENASYSEVESVFQPYLAIDWTATNARSDQYTNTVVIFEKKTDSGWVEVDESMHIDYRRSTWPNVIWFSEVADSGQYRLQRLRYTAKDITGTVLYYDDAFTAAGQEFSVNIAPVALTIEDVTAVNRTCDGTDQVELTGGTLQGILFGDDVSFTLGKGTMADAVAGTQKAVTTNIQLTGSKAGNYTLIQPTDLTVDVVCKPEKVPAKAATCMAEGNIEYWYCSDCQQAYLDENATQPIALSETVLPKLSTHTADGTGWHADENGHWLTCACGEKLEQSGHTFAWMVDREATDTQAGQKHQQCTVCGYQLPAVEIAAGTTAPKTNDEANMALWAMLMLTIGGGLVCVWMRERKSAQNR